MSLRSLTQCSADGASSDAPAAGRATSMTQNRPEKLQESQGVTHYTANGERFARIPYGEENPEWGQAPCSCCGAAKGQLHVVADCEYEACPACGAEQLGTCSHAFDQFGEEVAVSDGRVGSKYGERVLAALLGVVIALSVATVLAALRLI
jgi:hypothetical protein